MVFGKNPVIWLITMLPIYHWQKDEIKHFAQMFLQSLETEVDV